MVNQQKGPVYCIEIHGENSEKRSDFLESLQKREVNILKMGEKEIYFSCNPKYFDNAIRPLVEEYKYDAHNLDKIIHDV